MKPVSRVTARWLYSVFGVIILILTGFGIIISFVISSYYSSSVEAYLSGRAENLSFFYENYVYPDYPVLSNGVDRLAENFSESDKMELQVVDLSGRCVYSSLGYAVNEDSVNTSDYLTAKDSGEISFFKGKNAENNERIMAVSAPLRGKDGETVGVLRLRTSLTGVRKHLASVIMVVAALVVSMIIFVFISNYYFIGTLINPLQKISASADKIAKGDMNVRIENTYNDEIGDLCTSINNMASEIAENEQMKKDFISSVSHELRTPMTAIKGWSETLMLCDPKEDSETVKRGLSVVNSEVDRLSRMVEDLLDFSRIQSGRIKLNKKDILINMKLWDVVNIMAERAAKKSIRIATDIPEEDILTEADGDRLNQVFINIIDNAVKHSPEGSVIKVAMRVQDEDTVCITVSDSGEGISEEDLPHITEKFYKGANSKQGTGLGLALSNEIADLHGGSLNVSSKSGEGTAVAVCLPLKKG